MKRENLVEHYKFMFENPFLNHKELKFDNWIVEATSPDKIWIQESTEKIADWRGIFRSAYMQWAITINGLVVAKEKYEKIKTDDFAFEIKSFRLINGEHKIVPIANWDAETASKAHFDSIPLIRTYSFTDLYNCLEEFVFDLYRLYWLCNPDNLIKGQEFRELRVLKSKKDLGEQAQLDWINAFNERLNNWQRKKLYDNLGKVFLSYCNEARLQTPSMYKNTTIETWAETITGISIVRNSIVHGSKVVSKELADFCTKPYSLGFDFKEGDELKIELYHLQVLELFMNQLLSGINMALIERFRK